MTAGAVSAARAAGARTGESVGHVAGGWANPRLRSDLADGASRPTSAGGSASNRARAALRLVRPLLNHGGTVRGTVPAFFQPESDHPTPVGAGTGSVRRAPRAVHVAASRRVRGNPTAVAIAPGGDVPMRDRRARAASVDLNSRLP